MRFIWVFFFSSRRRHTRLVSDWSSDVCSSELERADDRSDRELPLAGERLWVDHEPGLALRGEDVVRVQVLVDEDLLSLRAGQIAQRLERRVEELAVAAPVLAR